MCMCARAWVRLVGRGCSEVRASRVRGRASAGVLETPYLETPDGARQRAASTANLRAFPLDTRQRALKPCTGDLALFAFGPFPISPVHINSIGVLFL